MMGKDNGTTSAGQAIRRCAVYTRKSTSIGLDQDFNSLDAQREACEQYVRSRERDGWRLLPRAYEDGGFTGANTNRPAFQRLLDDIDAGRIDIVVVYKVDRLSRSLLDFSQVMDRFNRAGAAFVSVTQNFSTADAMGRLTLNMLMSFAEFEREMIAERTRDKIAAARRKGKWTGGSVPLGYQIMDKKLVVDEVEAVLVREVFDLYLEHVSALEVARLLNQRGLATKRHQAKNGNVRKARPWTKDAVLRVVKNAIYAGLMPYGDEIHPGEHEPIVPEARWRQAQVQLRQRTRRTAVRPRNPDYLLRGLLRCAGCGAAFTPASTRKGQRTYRYYRCITRDKEGRAACPAKPLPAAAIEDFVVDRIHEATEGGVLAAEVRARIAERLDRERAELHKERAGLPRAIATLSAEGQQLVSKAAALSGPAARLLDDRLEEVGHELARLQDRLAVVERRLAGLDKIETEAAWVANALDDFAALWKAMTPPNRYRLVHALVHEVLVDEPSGEVTATLVDFGATPPDPDDEPAPDPPPVTNAAPSLRLVGPTEASP